MRAHIELEADRLRAEGLSDDEAYTRARKTFGNVTLSEEHFYEASRVLWFEHLRQDVGYAFRQTSRVQEDYSVICLGVDGCGPDIRVVAMYQKVDAQLDECPLVVRAPLFVTVADLNLELRVHFLLLGPFEEVLSLLEQIAGDDLALLAVNYRRDDGMRQKSLRLAAEEEDGRNAGAFDAIVID